LIRSSCSDLRTLRLNFPRVQSILGLQIQLDRQGEYGETWLLNIGIEIVLSSPAVIGGMVAPFGY
jgi:hypothetical protein